MGLTAVTCLGPYEIVSAIGAGARLGQYKSFRRRNVPSGERGHAR